MVYNETIRAWNFSKERFLIIQLYAIKDTKVEGGVVGKKERTSEADKRGVGNKYDYNKLYMYKMPSQTCYYV